MNGYLLNAELMLEICFGKILSVKFKGRFSLFQENKTNAKESTYSPGQQNNSLVLMLAADSDYTVYSNDEWSIQK